MSWLDDVKAISLFEKIIIETMPRCPKPQEWAKAFSKACADFQIDDRTEIAMLLAQVGHESADLTRLEENLNYSAERLVQVWPSRFPSIAAAKPYAHDPEALANKVYSGRMGNTRSGDGWLFRGRGPIMLTSRPNYEALAIAARIDCDTVPDILLDPLPGALSACWYWRSRVTMGSVEHVTKLVNGGLNGLADRERRYIAAKGLV